MAAQRKYPAWPMPNEKEVPYDTEHFKMWCVNGQDMTISTANAYVSSIRTAFSSLYDDDDPLFENLRIAFSSPVRPDPKRRVEKIENAYAQLSAHTELLKCGIDEQIKTVWITAFQAYCRFIRWRADNARRCAGMPVARPVDDPSTFLNIPMLSFFRQYLKRNGYITSSIDAICSHLTRLYNLYLRQILKHDVIEDFDWTLKRGRYSKEAIKHFFDKLNECLEEEIVDNSVKELSVEDLTRGKSALGQYYFFIIDYLKHPDKYEKISY